MSAHIAQRQRVEPLEPEIESSKPHRDIFQLYFSYEINEIWRLLFLVKLGPIIARFPRGEGSNPCRGRINFCNLSKVMTFWVFTIFLNFPLKLCWKWGNIFTCGVVVWVGGGAGRGGGGGRCISHTHPHTYLLLSSVLAVWRGALPLWCWGSVVWDPVDLKVRQFFWVLCTTVHVMKIEAAPIMWW